MIPRNSNCQVCFFLLPFSPCNVLSPVPVPAQSAVLGFSLAAACGQNFIYFTISNFNPLVCTTITTTRKFFTIVFSVFLFGHKISYAQWG